MQTPPTQVWPEGQSELLLQIWVLPAHAPLLQVLPEGQTLPQAPQLLGSELKSTHVPLQGSPVRQPLPLHTPLVHVSPEGQLLLLVQVWPLLAHTPLLQVSPVGQTSPQAPQLFGSVCRLVQAPLQAF